MAPITEAPKGKPDKGPATEGIIATWYASNTNGEIRGCRACAQSIIEWLAPGSCVLKVAPGSGHLVIEVAELGDYRVVGPDIRAE